MAERWDKYEFRSLDDLLKLVGWAVRLRPVKEVRLQGTTFFVRRQLTREENPFAEEDAEPPLEPPTPLPSDSIIDRLRTDTMEWGVSRSKQMTAAFFKALVIIQQKGMYATHIASGNVERLFGSLPAGTSLRDPESGKWGWFGGLEVVDVPDLGDGVHLVCGGHRSRGVLADIQIAVRMEAGE
jgi:hypothetical protein